MQEITFTTVFTTISTLDIIILLFLAYGGRKGFKKGFLVELVLLILFIASVLLVFRMIQGGFTYMETTEMGKTSRAFVLFWLLLFYAIVSIGISILGKILMGLLPSIFEGFDKFLGAILGVVKYVMFCGILFMLLEKSGIFDHQKIAKSTILYGIIMDIYEFMIGIGKQLTSTFMKDLVDSLERLLTSR